MPTTAERDTEALVADFEIQAGGSRIPPELQVVVTNIEVDLDVQDVGMFSLHLHAAERDQERFVVIDHDQFKPGNEIKIKIGYGSTLETMIVGEITALSPEYGNSGAVEIRINGHLSVQGDIGYEHFLFVDEHYEEDVFVPTLGVIARL